MRRTTLAILFVLVAACVSTANPDNAAIADDFKHQRSHVEVTAEGTVVQVLPDSTGPSGPHERFIVKLASGNLTVEIDHNLAIGRRVPVSEGDRVIVHGEYVWNSKGGLIHFTHHDPKGRREGGYIQDNGTTYD
jgi:uncharacterized protein YdeI (BOF family)